MTAINSTGIIGEEPDAACAVHRATGAARVEPAVTTAPGERRARPGATNPALNPSLQQFLQRSLLIDLVGAVFHIGIER